MHVARAFVLALLPAFIASAAEPESLALHGTVTGNLAAKESKTYAVDVAEGAFVKIALTATGYRAKATLTEPGGRKSSGFQGSSTDEGFITTITRTTGRGTITIEPARNGGGSGGPYTLTFLETRPSTEKEKDSDDGEHSYQEARDLEGEGTAEAMKKARVACEAALASFEKAGDVKGQGKALDELAFLHDFQGERTQALALYEKALEKERAVGDKAGEAFTLQGLGLTLGYLGEMKKALEVYERSLALARDLKDIDREGGTLHNIGGIYWQMDDMQMALEYYGRARPLLEAAHNERAVASNITNTGDTYRRLGDYPRARELFQKGLEMRIALGDKRGQGFCYQNMALLAEENGDLPRAMELFQKALALRKETGDKRSEAYSHGGIASVLHRQGKLDESLAERLEGVKLWNEIGDKGAKGETLEELADTYLALGRGDEAAKTYEEALVLCREAASRTWEAKAYAGLARLARSRGDLATARKRIEDALEIVETLRSRVSAPELRSTYFATVEDLYDFYIDVLLALERKEPGKGHDAEALRASESARARSFLESIASLRSDVRQGVDPALLAREKDARVKLQGKEQFRVRVLQGAHTEAQAAEAEEALKSAAAELTTIEEEIQRKSPAYAALVRPNPAGVTEIREQLDDDSVLLEFALGEEASHVFAVTKSALVVKDLPKQKEIEAAARDLRKLLSARNEVVKGESVENRLKRIAAADAAWPGEARAFSKLMLSPVAEALAGKRIVVVKDGILHYLPFSALPDPSDPAGRPLVASHEVVDLPSASVLATLRRPDPSRRAPDRLVAVLADPVFTRDDSRLSARDPKDDKKPFSLSEDVVRSAAESGLDGFSRLRFTRKEAETISALAPKEQRLTALDFAASRASATDPDLSRYRILHFATHGLVNSVHPELSGLVLSLVSPKGEPENGFLRLHEIYNLKLSADLVVLSACQTALGREIRGEGLVGLTRGFMYAGAPRVVASLWSVQDRATAELMKRFYDGMLAEKLRPAAALRKAQASMAGEARFSSPYFWAGFELEGEWR